MSVEDWLYDFDPVDQEECEQRCKYCGERGLYFTERGGRWILVDDEERAHAPHCRGRMAKPSEFPALEDDDGR